MCVAVPRPAEPKLNEPGFALAAATRSAAVFQPFAGLTTSTLAFLPNATTRGKILGRIVRNIRHDPRRDGVRRGIGEDGVAVRLRVHHRADADRAARAAAVLDHE